MVYISRKTLLFLQKVVEFLGKSDILSMIFRIITRILNFDSRYRLLAIDFLNLSKNYVRFALLMIKYDLSPQLQCNFIVD